MKLPCRVLAVVLLAILGGCSEDPGLASTSGDAVVADSSSTDSAVTVDSTAIDSATVDSAAVDSAKVDSAMVDSRIVDSARPDTSPPAACVAGTGDPITCAALLGTKKLLDLSSTELATFCDCWAASLGGYGVKSCTCTESGGVTTVSYGRATQAACVADFTGLKTTCTATVSDLLACSGAVAKDYCDALGAWTTAGCMAFGTCK